MWDSIQGPHGWVFWMGATFNASVRGLGVSFEGATLEIHLKMWKSMQSMTISSLISILTVCAIVLKGDDNGTIMDQPPITPRKRDKHTFLVFPHFPIWAFVNDFLYFFVFSIIVQVISSMFESACTFCMASNWKRPTTPRN